MAARRKRVPWLTGDVRQLKSLAKTTPARKIGRMMRRTEGAIRQKAFTLRISLGGWKTGATQEVRVRDLLKQTPGSAGIFLCHCCRANCVSPFIKCGGDVLGNGFGR